LFAQAREAAGLGNDERDAAGATLAVLLDDLRSAYGAEFGAVLDGSRVWVNGDEPADGPATTLHDGDEVAVLPPVSGG
jgi:molybdopterin converting factor small subunit